MARSLGNELPENKIWKTDLCMNNQEYRSILRYVSEFKIVDSDYFFFSHLLFSFHLFLFLGLKVRINVTSLSHHHTSVTW